MLSLIARAGQGLAPDTHVGLALLAEIAGLLIDVGAEGHNERSIRAGLALLDNHRQKLDRFMTTASMEYNLGNATIALVELHMRATGAPPGLADHDLLVSAKNHFWKALKALDGDGTFAHQVRTNLANALCTSGRITEALTTYDQILTTDPTFGMARFHRGLGLLTLERLRHGTTPSLLAQAANEYRRVMEATDVSPAVRDVATTMHERITKRLTAHGYGTERIQDEAHEALREAARHTPYRQFTLQHQLALCEHALYCRCTGARRDDLMIATPNMPVSGDLVPRMELIVNRIKAEFGTARLLYYQATQDCSWELHEHDITFAELFEGERVSIRTELLRTSFRLCLGIVDKIALGLPPSFLQALASGGTVRVGSVVLARATLLSPLSPAPVTADAGSGGFTQLSYGLFGNKGVPALSPADPFASPGLTRPDCLWINIVEAVSRRVDREQCDRLPHYFLCGVPGK